MRFGTLVRMAVFLAAPGGLWAADSHMVAHGASALIAEHGVSRCVTNGHASGRALFVPTRTAPEWAAFYNGPPPGVTAGSCACALPWGGSVAHGGAVTAYAASSVGCGGSCASQVRTCNNGTLSGSYQYASCNVAACVMRWKSTGTWQAGAITCSPSNPTGVVCSTLNATCRGSPGGVFSRAVYRCEYE